MPYPNEHAARLRNPDDFDADTFRRTKGGTIYGSTEVPKTISIIWGKLKESNKPSDAPIPQALRFPTKDWSATEAKKWLKDNKIKFIDFEEAKTEEDKSMNENIIKREIGERIDVTNSFTINAIPELSKEFDDVNKSVVTVEKSLNYGEVEVIVSNSGVDRHGEQILMEGIDTTQVKRNPVVLWAHEYSGLPIGQITKVWKSAGNLMARIKLDYDIYDFADTVYKMIIRGTINAVSIGGIVKEWNEDYTIIKKMEMMELSVVPVGAHPDALVTAKSLGMDYKVFQKQYDEFVQKSLIDKFKEMPENKICDYIDSLKAVTSALESIKESKKPEATKDLSEDKGEVRKTIIIKLR